MKESGTGEVVEVEDKMVLDTTHSRGQVGMGNNAKRAVQWGYQAIGAVVAG